MCHKFICVPTNTQEYMIFAPWLGLYTISWCPILPPAVSHLLRSVEWTQLQPLWWGKKTQETRGWLPIVCEVDPILPVPYYACPSLPSPVHLFVHLSTLDHTYLPINFTIKMITVSLVLLAGLNNGHNFCTIKLLYVHVHPLCNDSSSNDLSIVNCTSFSTHSWNATKYVPFTCCSPASSSPTKSSTGDMLVEVWAVKMTWIVLFKRLSKIVSVLHPQVNHSRVLLANKFLRYSKFPT